MAARDVAAPGRRRMNGRAVSLETVVEGLRADGLLAAEREGQASALIERLRAVQPWYIRTMVGCGAWLASLLLIGSVGGLGLALGGSSVIGLILLAGAIWLRRRPDTGANDFVIQCTLATSLAGQALLGWGVAEMLPGDTLKSACLMVAIMSTVLFFVFPDRIHRVLMVLFAIAAVIVLLYIYALNAVVPVLGPLLAAALVWLYLHHAALTAGKHGNLVRPLENGLILSAFGCLLVSTLYVLPELGLNDRFYPRPWISTLLLGALFLYVGGRTWPARYQHSSHAAVPMVYALMLIVIAAAWFMPGLLLALVVLMLGASAGHRTFVGAGIAFLTVFIGTYFYGIEVSMLTKSVTLVGTGTAILLARWMLLNVLGAEQHG